MLTRHHERSSFYRMAQVIPEGAVGGAAISHFAITGKEFLGFRRDDYISPGTYARLTRGGGVWMSDTNLEQRTNLEAVRRATGDVLVAGLGIGLMVLPVLLKPEVRRVVVVELDPDVIDLVAQPLADAAGPDAWKLSVVEADIFAWSPGQGQRFDLIWFDIWRDICTDNLAGIATLHQRFKGRKTPAGWMGSWQAEHLRSLRRRDRSSAW